MTGLLFALVVVPVVAVLSVLAFYWTIRLAVSHGIQDARRAEGTARALAGVSETIRRQQATYGGPTPE
jgi:CHASE3 domain sensor protein